MWTLGSRRTADPVAPVWADPEDDELKRVVADALLEAGNPWGELIVLQLRIAEKKAKPAERKRAAVLEKQREQYAGPLARVTRKSPWKVEKGFLVECAPQKKLVPRADWEAAAHAPHWATVRRVMVDAIETPRWWITELMKNPATRKSLRVFDVGPGHSPSRFSLRVEHASPDAPWRVVKASRHKVYGSILPAFAKGLARGEPLVIAPSVPAESREMLESALARRSDR